MSIARQNFPELVEEGINRQILTELTASYVYQSMSSWFARDTVSLPGLSKYYAKQTQSVDIQFLLCTNNL